MFKHLVNKKSKLAKDRKLIDCGKDWILFYLISFPVSPALAKHGFLLAPGDLTRVAKVVTYIESVAGKDPKEERD